MKDDSRDRTELLSAVVSQVDQGHGQSVSEGDFAVSGGRWVPDDGGADEGEEGGVLFGV